MISQRDMLAAAREVRPSTDAWFATARNVAMFAQRERRVRRPGQVPEEAQDAVTRDAYRQAGSLAEVGRYEDAERELRGGLAAGPADADLLTLLGYVLRMRRDYAAALRTCEAAVGPTPSLADAHAERAENLIALIRSGDAVVAAGEAARLDPQDPAGHLVLARALAVGPRARPARAAAKRGLALDPGSVEALLTVADVERDAGRHDAAMAPPARRWPGTRPAGTGGGWSPCSTPRSCTSAARCARCARWPGTIRPGRT